jgi:chromosome segregation ATPase
MIFGQIKMMITILLITGIAGAGIYVMKLRADNATLKANQIKLETAVEEQNKVLEQQKADFTAILESNKKLNVLINTFKKDLQDLDKRFTKKNRDIGKLAIDRTKAIERIINKGGKNAARCIELASGAEHTEAELKATLKSEINPECPALANPNYVPYQ